VALVALGRCHFSLDFRDFIVLGFNPYSSASSLYVLFDVSHAFRTSSHNSLSLTSYHLLLFLSMCLSQIIRVGYVVGLQCCIGLHTYRKRTPSNRMSPLYNTMKLVIRIVIIY